jgi:hypothetical protein
VGSNDPLRRTPACRRHRRQRRDVPAGQGVATGVTGAGRRVRARLGTLRHGLQRRSLRGAAPEMVAARG